MKNNFSIIAATLLLAACSGNGSEQAQQILKESQRLYDNKDYEGTLRMIDSLRHSCPEAMKERKEALALFQDASEKLAQSQVAATDSALQAVTNEIQTAEPAVEEHRRNGSATADELSRLTVLKLKRDSLKVRFDTQCATIRLIREKRKGN